MSTLSVTNFSYGGGFGNGTYGQIIAESNNPAMVVPSATGGFLHMFDLIEAFANLGASVTAGTLNVQILLPDFATWVNVGTPTPVATLTTASPGPTYNFTFFGPFLGARIVIAGITGGTINSIGCSGSFFHG